MFGGVLLFHPGWVVSSALAGLASGFGMGPGVSLPLLTAVTVSTCFQVPHRVVGKFIAPGDFWWWGVVCLSVWVCGCEVFGVCKFSAG